MRFDDASIDLSGVDDQRGSGGGGFGGLGGGGLAAGGGGLGVIGLIAYLVIGVLGGTDPTGGGLGGVPGGFTVNGSGSNAAVTDVRERCASAQAQERDVDCRLIKVYNIADEVWAEDFSRRGIAYQPPRLGFFTSSVSTQCGRATSQVGPFYCPGNEQIYFDLRFLEQLQRQLGAGGDFAQAYIVAHEFGHHLQTLLGTEQQVRQQQQAGGNENAYSVALELQADCYAGAWTKLADQRDDGIVLEQGDIEEGLGAAAAVGDDAIQAQSGGSVDQESFTHGSSAERVRWFRAGLASGNLESCDTFSERGLQL